LDEKEHDVYKWVFCIAVTMNWKKNANVVIGC
jgi:hypothetical protein